MLDFYKHVCNFLGSVGYSFPTLDLWLDIRESAKNGERVKAIRSLSRGCVKNTYKELEVPATCAPSAEFTEYVRSVATINKRENLSILESKAIVDWLIHNENVFSNKD